MRGGVEREVVLCAATGQSGAEIMPNRSPTLNCNCEQPYICFNGGASPQAGSIACSAIVTPTLKAASSGLRTPCICEPDIARTLAARGDSSPCADRGQNIIVHPKICGTLCGSGAGLTRPAGLASETDLCVCHRRSVTGECVCRERSKATAVDCRNLKEIAGQSGTLQAKRTAGYSLHYQNPIRDGYIVRRLTPTECERLMGFFDGYTAYGHDGKPVSDSKRYSMLGNSIATPCAVYILQNILEQYGR